MNNNILNHIYKDTNMSILTLNKLLSELKNKDNKITKDIENLIKGYERYNKEVKKLIKKENIEVQEDNFMTKIMAKEGIKKEVSNDNSDSFIANLLIKGITISSLDMEKLLDREDIPKNHIKIAKDFMKFNKDNIESLKKYL